MCRNRALPRTVSTQSCHCGDWRHSPQGRLRVMTEHHEPLSDKVVEPGPMARSLFEPL